MKYTYFENNATIHLVLVLVKFRPSNSTKIILLYLYFNPNVSKISTSNKSIVLQSCSISGALKQSTTHYGRNKNMTFLLMTWDWSLHIYDSIYFACCYQIHYCFYLNVGTTISCLDWLVIKTRTHPTSSKHSRIILVRSKIELGCPRKSSF